MAPKYSDYWLEPFDHAVRRWRLANGGDPLPPAPEMAEIAERRARVLLDHTRAKLPRQLGSPRQWEAYWNADEHRPLVEALIKRYGWKVRVVRASDDRPAPYQAQESDVDTALVQASELAPLLARIHASDCPFAMGERDLLLFRLAEELFHIIALKVGREPREEWIGELAIPRAQQLLLGTPFTTLAFGFIR
ncbi:MAG: hypothetical protein SF028_06785 [Candidatus Sumerlaeia bacterium]|nr:hypothetical protein [Candidatus Sumerlaeia bacterium]